MSSSRSVGTIRSGLMEKQSPATALKFGTPRATALSAMLHVMSMQRRFSKNTTPMTPTTKPSQCQESTCIYSNRISPEELLTHHIFPHPPLPEQKPLKHINPSPPPFHILLHLFHPSIHPTPSTPDDTHTLGHPHIHPHPNSEKDQHSRQIYIHSVTIPATCQHRSESFELRFTCLHVVFPTMREAFSRPAVIGSQSTGMLLGADDDPKSDDHYVVTTACSCEGGSSLLQ